MYLKWKKSWGEKRYVLIVVGIRFFDKMAVGEQNTRV
jgi:hypothetical protein